MPVPTKSRRFFIMALSFCLLGIGGTTFAISSSSLGGATAAATVVPIRAAFYYPWYPETEKWATHFTPTAGHYNSSDTAVLARHVAQARSAGLDAFISSWWGQGSKTANRLPLLLNAARAQSNFHVAPYYERESQSPAPTAASLKSDFDALYKESVNEAAWLRVNTKPVLFTFNTGTQATCAAVARVMTANAGRFYLNMKVFEGYLKCASQPDSWHQYGPATGYDRQGAFSASVSPGFFKFNEATPRLARELSRFKQDLARQVASGAQWQLVTTFNEWGEGTSVEPATQWASASKAGTYLDAMRAAYGVKTPPTTTPVTTPATKPVTTPATKPVTTPATKPATTPVTTPATKPATTPVTTPATKPATTPVTTPSGITKVLTIVEENHSLNEMKSGMPYLFSLSQRFAYASNYAAIRHPSLPNYLAIAGGSTFGVTDDAAPSSHPVSAASVFGQAVSAGRTARTYAEGMATNCMLTSSGKYAVKHNPQAYFTAERSQCATNNVPSGTSTSGRLHTDIAAGTLPNAGMVVPNLCNDAHDCALGTADTWLKGWLPQILAGPDFTSGRLAVVITADEDDSSQSNLVLTTVLALKLDGAHKVVTTPLTHYSLTGYYDFVDHTAGLLGAATAPSFAAAFGL